MKISVGSIIEYTMRSGSIESVSLSDARAVDGTKAHQKFQKSQLPPYEAEVTIEHLCVVSGMEFLIQGRMDGLIKRAEGVMIDEIKSTGAALSQIKGDNRMHWAQVKFYAYMYAVQHKEPMITCRMTYISLEKFDIKQFEENFSFEQLEEFFFDVVGKYAAWAKKIAGFEEIATKSMKALSFPFSEYRDGQKKMMAGVYKTIVDEQRLFSRAPTGIGKTIATLFPSLKAKADQKTEKIFYLTAKTIGKEVAASTLDLLSEKGLICKRIVITAKDKTCQNGEATCNKEQCPYADGHFDRVNQAIEELYDEEDYFCREVIEEKARKYMVCPYELSLDMALFSDVIICDYNYVFDPSATLRRFFMEGSRPYTVLVDEAHNLVDRGRSMYSASLEKDQVMLAKKIAKVMDAKLYKYLSSLNKKMNYYRKECESYERFRFESEEMPYEIEDDLRAILFRIEKIFKEHKDSGDMPELLDFFFTVYDYVKKTEFYSEKYVTYYEKRGNNLIINLYCLDPSDNIRLCLQDLRGVVFFSATLLPMNYYMDLLGGTKENYGIILPSPFDPKKLGLIVDGTISTKYLNRESSIFPIGERIRTITLEKKGNYLIFFPSYKYMDDVLNHLTMEYSFDQEVDILYQKKGMSELEKEEYMKEFSSCREKSLVAFSVMGGMFSEGIDLVGDRLIGTIIVGVGLPMVCYENDLIRNHFDKTLGRGFDYAYVYPGMNKVLQSAGRVIRTVDDKGVVVLLDERFMSAQYNRLFPKEWEHHKVVYRNDDLYQFLETFWTT